MIYEWHRALDTVIVTDDNPKFYRFRPYYYSMPVLREDLGLYLDYPCSDEMAVSLALGKRNDAHYPELLLKRACWLVKNLCEQTDIASSGTKLVFSVDNALKVLAMRYFEGCNFPMSAINWLDFDESNNPFSSKFDAVLSDVFKPFRHVLHIDVAVRIGNHPTQYQLPLFSRIKEKWDDEIFAQAGRLLRDRCEYMNNAKEREWWKHNRNYFVDYMGWSVEDEEHYWDTADPFYYVGGMMMGFHRHLLDNPSFAKDIIYLNGLSDDELAMCYYARRNEWSQFDAIDFSSCFNWGGFDPNDTGYYVEAPIIHYQHIQSIGEVNEKRIHAYSLY